MLRDRRWIAVVAACAGATLSSGCAGMFSMPSHLDVVGGRVDTLVVMQAASDSVLRRLSRTVTAQEDLLRTSRAESGSRMEELLTRNEAVASNLEEATRQVSLLQQRLTSIDARLERSGGGLPSGGGGDSLQAVAQLFAGASSARARGDWKAAADAYEKVIVLLGNDPLAGEATYQLGETREAMRSLDAALKAYRTVVTQFPSSPRVPRAMYRAAMVLDVLKEKPSSAETLRNLIAAYPDSPDAASARDHLAATAAPSSGTRKRR